MGILNFWKIAFASIQSNLTLEVKFIFRGLTIEITAKWENNGCFNSCEKGKSKLLIVSLWNTGRMKWKIFGNIWNAVRGNVMFFDISEKAKDF